MALVRSFFEFQKTIIEFLKSLPKVFFTVPWEYIEWNRHLFPIHFRSEFRHQAPTCFFDTQQDQGRARQVLW